GQIAVPEPRGGVDEAPAATLAHIEPPVARIVEQLEDTAGIASDPGVVDREDHLAVALVPGLERAEVVVVQRPHAGIDDLLRPERSAVPLGRHLEAGAPE